MKIRKSLINFVLILGLMITSLSITNATSGDTESTELDGLINSLMDTSAEQDTNTDTQVDSGLDAITSNTESESSENTDLGTDLDNLGTDLDTMTEDNSVSLDTNGDLLIEDGVSISANEDVMLEPENTTNSTEMALEETNVDCSETAVSTPINNNTSGKLSAAGMGDLSMLLLALFSSIGYFIYRRKQKNA